MSMYSTTIAILTSWDLGRLERAILSAVRQTESCNLWVEINSLDPAYHAAAAQLCRDYRVEYHVSERSGTAGIGKQAVFDRFASKPGEYLLLLDGDDWLYPCAVEALLDLSNRQRFDVLTQTQYDLILSEPRYPGMGGYRLSSDVVATINRVPNAIEWWTGCDYSLWSDPTVQGKGLTNVFSRRATTDLRWDEQIGCYEDVLLFYRSLDKHKRSALQSVLLCGQVILIHDLTTPNGGQKRADFTGATRELRRKLRLFLNPEDSSYAELPSVEAPSLIAYEDKLDFIRRSYRAKEHPHFIPRRAI